MFRGIQDLKQSPPTIRVLSPFHLLKSSFRLIPPLAGSLFEPEAQGHNQKNEQMVYKNQCCYYRFCHELHFECPQVYIRPTCHQLWDVSLPQGK